MDNSSKSKSVFLHVYGGDYSAMIFDQSYKPQEVYEDMMKKGEQHRVIDEEDYIEIRIKEFNKVDDEFLSWVKNTLCDYDELKSEDIFEIRPI